MKQIILTGFMGCGKTTIGQALATHLQWPFLDLDDCIVQDQQLIIPEIFSEMGEAYFRTVEQRVLRELLQAEGVLALGGGTLANPDSRALVFSQDALIVHLTAPAEIISQRVSQQIDQRPLLSAQCRDLNASIQRLLDERQEIYSRYDVQLDTAQMNIPTITAFLAQFRDVQVRHVSHPDGGYPIWIGRNLLKNLGKWIQARGNFTQVILLSDAAVKDNYLPMVLNALKTENIAAEAVIFPGGERNKSLETVANLYTALAERHADRNTLMVALGGGITGDICGFTAATYMRGIPFLQIPTTFLAMVDASIGGKTAVNLDQGKNMVGAFHQPHVVVMDLDTLRTLPREEIVNGFAEFLKHGLIGAPDLIGSLLEMDPSLRTLMESPEFTNLLLSSLDVKRRLVEQDPFEKNQRRQLNFGHTFAHALEKASHYQIPHGKAVLIGMWVAARLSLQISHLAEAAWLQIEKLYARYRLPRWTDGLSLDDIFPYLLSDKKKQGNIIFWILLKDIGDAEIVPLSLEESFQQLKVIWEECHESKSISDCEWS